MMAESKNITVTEASHLLDSGQLVLIDCRREEERSKMYIPGSVHLEDVKINKNALKKYGFTSDKLIAIHCKKGGRAKRVCKALRGEGFTNVKNLDGGIEMWKEQGLPTKCINTEQGH
jgi:rhodanese-related sulfurtransferase